MPTASSASPKSICVFGRGQRRAARASYAYRPYGSEDPELTKGDADPEAILNPYRFQQKRIDVISSTLDMGARRFGPDLTRFIQEDRYLGANSDLGLALDPLTRNRYVFAGGNPVSFIETDGHAFVASWRPAPRWRTARRSRR